MNNIILRDVYYEDICNSIDNAMDYVEFLKDCSTNFPKSYSMSIARKEYIETHHEMFMSHIRRNKIQEE